MTFTVTGFVTKLCPYKDEVDRGSATLVFLLGDDGDGPELHELADVLASYAGMRMSHEDFTRHLLADTKAIQVESVWQTAGLDVRVTAP